MAIDGHRRFERLQIKGTLLNFFSCYLDPRPFDWDCLRCYEYYLNCMEICLIDEKTEK